MWIINSIFEADFGCEERMPGEPLMVTVQLSCDDGRICRLDVPDVWLENQGLDEGDEWPINLDEKSESDITVMKQSEFMNEYYDALEELELNL